MARRRRGDSDTAAGGGSSEMLTMMVFGVLVIGFGAFMFGGSGANLDWLFPKSGPCSDPLKKNAAKNAIAANMGTYIRNHLNKAVSLTNTQIAYKIVNGYPSALNAMADQSGCVTVMPTVSGFFYKTYATVVLKVAPQLGTGVNLSSGALAAMKLMASDGGRTHLTAFVSSSYPGFGNVTDFELKKIAMDAGMRYSESMPARARSFASLDQDQELVFVPANVEDYTTIDRDVEMHY